jgi:hypothetical protein
MTSNQEIKNLFTNELLNTPQYQIIKKIKQHILDEIAAPNIQENVIYNFEIPQTIEEQSIISMCSIIEFGFPLTNMSECCVCIDMKKFLN